MLIIIIIIIIIIIFIIIIIIIIKVPGSLVVKMHSAIFIVQGSIRRWFWVKKGLYKELSIII